MKNITTLVLVFAIFSLASGCAMWSGYDGKGFGSTVGFEKAGHKIVGSVSSTVDCGYIFGAIPLDDVELYKRAMTDIRAQANLKGRSAALAHITQDIVVKDFFIYKSVALTISADVVEFTK
jgi:hypothetical protein